LVTDHAYGADQDANRDVLALPFCGLDAVGASPRGRGVRHWATQAQPVEADLAVARGRVIQARSHEQRTENPDELALFQRAVELYRLLGDVRGEGESLFWVGTYHQMSRRDNDTAVPVFERSYELAALVGDKRTMSEALRHLGIAEHAAGRLDAAWERLEESVRLRREIGFMPGVAANLVGLAYVAAGQGRRDDALALIDEASSIADASGAQAIVRQVAQARTQL